MISGGNPPPDVVLPGTLVQPTPGTRITPEDTKVRLTYPPPHASFVPMKA